MTSAETQTKSIGWIVAAAAAAAIFTLDLMTPLGYAVPMLYGIPLLITWFGVGVWNTFFMTGAAILLTWGGAALSSGEVSADVVANRTLVSGLLLVIGWLVINRKRLAEQRDADQASLRESKERFAKAFQTSPHPIGITEVATGRCIEVNEACLQLFGFCREEVIGNTTLMLGIWLDQAERARLVERLKAGKPVRNLEQTFRTKSGNVRHILVSSDLAELGGTLCLITIGNDITERKQAEEAVRELNRILEQRVRERTTALVEANERWDWVVRATNDGVWDWDLFHGTLYYSPRWREMHGFAGSDQTESTKEWLARIHPEDRDRVHVAFDRCRTDQRAQLYQEYRIQRKDGTYFWVLDRGITIFDNEGRAIRMVGAETDITALKASEALLREREAQLHDLGARLLRAQEEERRRISRDLHDDVMQRMGALALELYGLAASTSLQDTGMSSQLKTIGAAAEQLTTDLQQMAHQLHPSVLEFGGLEMAVREHVNEFAARTGLSAELLTHNVPKDIALDHATCLYRVLQEGLQNVQKHADATTVLVRLLKTGRGVGLYIHDDGRGIEQSDGAARRKGLGLTSMAERVGMLNGIFRIRSKPNDGTELHAWVPLEDVKCET